MKYYPVVYPDGLKQYVDTQAQAKALGVKNPEPTELPTDKDGLRDLVNKYESLLHSRPAVIKPTVSEITSSLEIPKLTSADVDAMFAPQSAKKKAKPEVTQDDVIEFILDNEGYKLANVFAAVLERVTRMKKEIDNADPVSSISGS